MENKNDRIILLAQTDNEHAILELLKYGLDPNFEEGRLMRLAARHGAYSVVKTLLQWGGNPSLPDGSGATTLQLAVFSGLHWEKGCWEVLLSHSDSSQLVDAAAVAIVFNKTSAFKQILKTGRCPTNMPTSLTGRTVESLAKSYQLEHVIREIIPHKPQQTQYLSPTLGTRPGESISNGPSRHLSPSVAHFFEQSARQQSTLSPGHKPMLPLNHSSPAFTSFSPTNNRVLHTSPLSPAYNLGHNLNHAHKVLTNNLRPAQTVMFNHLRPAHNLVINLNQQPSIQLQSPATSFK